MSTHFINNSVNPCSSTYFFMWGSLDFITATKYSHAFLALLHGNFFFLLKMFTNKTLRLPSNTHHTQTFFFVINHHECHAYHQKMKCLFTSIKEWHRILTWHNKSFSCGSVQMVTTLSLPCRITEPTFLHVKMRWKFLKGEIIQYY